MMAMTQLSKSEVGELAMRGGWAPKGSHALRKYGVQDIQDIAYLAVSESEADEMQIRPEWQAARSCGSVDDNKKMRMLLQEFPPPSLAPAQASSRQRGQASGTASKEVDRLEKDI